jgi:ABC-type multidrug transport system permease subunit
MDKNITAKHFYITAALGFITFFAVSYFMMTQLNIINRKINCLYNTVLSVSVLGFQPAGADPNFIESQKSLTNASCDADYIYFGVRE